MDRNSAIGLTLIAVLLLLYFNFFSPSPTPTQDKPAEVTTTQTPLPDSSVTQNTKGLDSAEVVSYGDLSSLLTGSENLTRVETNDLAISFSSQGGLIKELELRKFKTYSQKPLVLVSPETNSFSLTVQHNGKEIDLYKLSYTAETKTEANATWVTFTAAISADSFIKQIYSIPSSGYQIDYSIETKGLNLNGPHATFSWNDFVPLQEKDIQDSRVKTTINYYTAEGKFDNLSETSTSLESETLATPVNWVSIRQKFFINAIIAKKPFSGGEVSTNSDPNSLVTVKEARMRLFVPIGNLANQKAEFTYFFGPNDYSMLSSITEGFSRNLYIGWPPVLWVNKFLIIPIFKFLENYIGNYGIIIVILVLVVKLVLSPLSYKSYLGMAKMKLLKPELDLIKEKNGDNMAQTQQDQLKLYQQAGVNPFSGCIPLLLQMPILFAMFYFFPVSIELRQKPFLWAEDLSTYDSVLNLPFTIPFYGDHVSLFVLLMTASTLVYTWQNNQISSVQGPMKSMSYIMPVVFMFVLNSFSAGLSFYYFVSNLVTFAQQAIIKRFVDEEKIKTIMDDHKKKMASGTSKKSSFMSKLESAMKASEEARKKNARH